jgi:hypothetical protein
LNESTLFRNKNMGIEVLLVAMLQGASRLTAAGSVLQGSGLLALSRDN